MKTAENLNKLQKELAKRGIYCSIEEFEEAKEFGCLELVKKASGDSHEMNTKEFFGDNFEKVSKLAAAQGITLAEEVWFD